MADSLSIEPLNIFLDGKSRYIADPNLTSGRDAEHHFHICHIGAEPGVSILHVKRIGHAYGYACGTEASRETPFGKCAAH